METSTKQDKLLFFGITFAALAAFTFIINYVNPIAGFGIEYIFLLAILMAGIITILKFDLGKITEKYKNINPYLISGIIWSVLAIMKWLKYFNKDLTNCLYLTSSDNCIYEFNVTLSSRL
jgi:hypothetical protein